MQFCCGALEFGTHIKYKSNNWQCYTSWKLPLCPYARKAAHMLTMTSLAESFFQNNKFRLLLCTVHMVESAFHLAESSTHQHLFFALSIQLCLHDSETLLDGTSYWIRILLQNLLQQWWRGQNISLFHTDADAPCSRGTLVVLCCLHYRISFRGKTLAIPHGRSLFLNLLYQRQRHCEHIIALNILGIRIYLSQAMCHLRTSRALSKHISSSHRDGSSGGLLACTQCCHPSYQRNHNQIQDLACCYPLHGGGEL